MYVFTPPSRTTDNTGADIKARYTSELNRSIKGSVASKFEERVMRKFPGVPKSVEDFRELLVKKYGDTAVLKLRRLFKIIDSNCNGTLSRAELQTGLKDFGLEITEDEFFSLWSYFDKDRSDSIGMSVSWLLFDSLCVYAHTDRGMHLGVFVALSPLQITTSSCWPCGDP